MREIKPNTFIFEFENALKQDDCLSIIDMFESNKEDHYQGKIGQNLNEDLIESLVKGLAVLKEQAVEELDLED